MSSGFQFFQFLQFRKKNRTNKSKFFFFFVRKLLRQTFTKITFGCCHFFFVFYVSIHAANNFYSKIFIKMSPCR